MVNKRGCSIKEDLKALKVSRAREARAGWQPHTNGPGGGAENTATADQIATLKQRVDELDRKIDDQLGDIFGRLEAIELDRKMMDEQHADISLRLAALEQHVERGEDLSDCTKVDRREGHGTDQDIWMGEGLHASDSDTQGPDGYSPEQDNRWVESRREDSDADERDGYGEWEAGMVDDRYEYRDAGGREEYSWEGGEGGSLYDQSDTAGPDGPGEQEGVWRGETPDAGSWREETPDASSDGERWEERGSM